MSDSISRRTALSTVGTALAAACSPSQPAARPAAAAAASNVAAPPVLAAREEIAEVEARVGGRIGFFALDTGSGRELEHRADERFALCSTFKWILAAAILERVDHGELALQQPVAFTEKDVLEYAPVTRENLARGALSVEELAAASVVVSDNSAANLLLPLVGGPAGLTAFLRRHGDSVTRLDRDEPMLNTNLANDPRDTTSPRAMATTLRTIVLGTVLSPGSRERLRGWLEATSTGMDRLRAGLPPSFRVGDKTGTGERGAVNDVAVVWPPRGAPIVIACYMSGSAAPLRELKAAHAELARRALRNLLPAPGVAPTPSRH